MTSDTSSNAKGGTGNGQPASATGEAERGSVPDRSTGILNTRHHRVSSATIPYLIAEIGLNHNGDMALAIRMIESAAAAGAHCVKFQLYDVRGFIQERAILGSGPEGSLPDFFRQFQLPPESWRKLARVCEQLKVDFLCSVFDGDSLRFYKELNPSHVKIASTDLTNRLLLEDARSLGFELLLSTGASNESEIARTISWVGTPAVLFQCVSSYPARPDEYNLSLLPAWSSRFGCTVGLSDHCEDITVALGSYMLGARAIERHFTIDRTLPGPDQGISSTPDQMRRLRAELETLHAAQGNGVKDCMESEKGVRTFGRRALYFSRDLHTGELLKKSDLLALRPGGGPGPERYEEFVGRSLRSDVKRGQPLRPEDFV